MWKYLSSLALSKMKRTVSRVAASMNSPPCVSRLCIAPMRTAIPELSTYVTFDMSMIRRLGFSSMISRSVARISGATWRSIAPSGAKTFGSVVGGDFDMSGGFVRQNDRLGVRPSMVRIAVSAISDHLFTPTMKMTKMAVTAALLVIVIGRTAIHDHIGHATFCCQQRK